MKIETLGPFVLLALAAAAPAAAFDVQGTITDSAGNPIVGIKVDVFDAEAGADLLLATVYTDGNGVYTATIAGGWGAGNPDIYINVEWKWQLSSPPPTHGGAHLHLLKKLDYHPATKNYTPRPSYTPKMSATTAGHDPATDLTQDLMMDQALNPPSAGGLEDMPTLALHVKEALDYYEANKGAVGWSWSQDVRLFLLGNTRSSFVLAKDGWQGFDTPLLCIAGADINGTGAGATKGFVSDIYHEMAHYLHYVFNGNSLPASTFGKTHRANTESELTFALKEGWASYVGHLTDQQRPGPAGPDGKFAHFTDDGGGGLYPPRSLWRGDEGAADGPSPGAPGPTGREPPDIGSWVGGDFESGDIVEGALSGAWFGIDADALFTEFETNFKVLFEDGPNDIHEFRAALIDNVGADTPEADRVYEILNEHGIVSSRARLGQDPFTLPQSSAAGTAIAISDTVYIRGAVEVKFEALQQADLGLAKATVPLERARLRWNTAFDDLTNAPEHFLPGNETPWEGFALGKLTFDTLTLAIADGDYDLLLQGENEDGAEDNFYPTWGENLGTMPVDNGDSNPSVNLDEKYFKVIGAWFDTDRNPVTNTAIGGKVVVDNTAPTVNIIKSP